MDSTRHIHEISSMYLHIYTYYPTLRIIFKISYTRSFILIVMSSLSVSTRDQRAAYQYIHVQLQMNIINFLHIIQSRGACASLNKITRIYKERLWINAWHSLAFRAVIQLRLLFVITPRERILSLSPAVPLTIPIKISWFLSLCYSSKFPVRLPLNQ